MEDDRERIEVAVVGSLEPVVFYGPKRTAPQPNRIEELERRVAELERQARYTHTNAIAGQHLYRGVRGR